MEFVTEASPIPKLNPMTLAVIPLPDILDDPGFTMHSQKYLRF
jgi:hypothetical protein